jgi:hypothetical protein
MKLRKGVLASACPVGLAVVGFALLTGCSSGGGTNGPNDSSLPVVKTYQVVCNDYDSAGNLTGIHRTCFDADKFDSGAVRPRSTAEISP